MWLLDGLFFHPEDRGSRFLRNIGEIVPDYTASYHRQCYSSKVYGDG
jgi:hypothetical protein